MRGAATAIVTTARRAARAIVTAVSLGAARAIVTAVSLGAVTVLGGLDPGLAGAAADRLDQFRELAPVIDAPDSTALAEVYALLDGEIAENLAGGGVFASGAFLQDRLEAFAETWGGLAPRLVALDRTLAVAFAFTTLSRGSTVRFYARGGGPPGPLMTLAGEGWPSVRPLPPGSGAARQVLIAWDGPPGAAGARPVRFDVVVDDARGVRVAWSSTAAAPEGMTARWYAVRGTEIAVRHEARHAGWTPGCTGQAEYEDVYRLPRGASAFARVSRREVNGWHREVHAAAERVFAALARGDREGLGLLVADASLRARLPASLRHAPACAGLPGRDGAVAIAAEAREHEPWTLTFRRAPGGWRLAAATPVAP